MIESGQDADVDVLVVGSGPVVLRPNSFGAGTGVTHHAEHLEVGCAELVEQGSARYARGATSTPQATPTSRTSPASATRPPARPRPPRR